MKTTRINDNTLVIRCSQNEYDLQMAASMIMVATLNSLNRDEDMKDFEVYVKMCEEGKKEMSETNKKEEEWNKTFQNSST